MAKLRLSWLIRLHKNAGVTMNLPVKTGAAMAGAKRAPQPESLKRLWANQHVPLGEEKSMLWAFWSDHEMRFEQNWF